MRNLTVPIGNLLVQIHEMLENLSDEQFLLPVPVLAGATLGQHTRHIIEFYLELMQGYQNGVVNYDARKRDQEIESNRLFAIERLQLILQQLNRADKQLQITGDYGSQPGQVFTISTNYARELMYNLEHTVHHMALLRIGVTTLSAIDLPLDFGVAISTIKYRKHVHSNIYTH